MRPGPEGSNLAPEDTTAEQGPERENRLRLKTSTLWIPRPLPVKCHLKGTWVGVVDDVEPKEGGMVGTRRFPRPVLVHTVTILDWRLTEAHPAPEVTPPG